MSVQRLRDASLLVLAGLGFVAGGCAPPAAQPTTPSQHAAAPADPEQGKNTAALELRTGTWDDVQRSIAEHKGKFVVVDLWSTYCVPCLRELPGLTVIQTRFGNDVVCLSLNCNFNGLGTPDDERAAIEAELQRAGLHGIQFISADADEVLYQRLGIAAIPVVQIYDRTGQLVKQFDNEQELYGAEGFTYAGQIVPWLEEQLADSANEGQPHERRD